MQVSLYCGDIVRAPADVICTSTNPHLELILGTGGAVRNAGGQSIQDECRRLIDQEKQTAGKVWLEPGRAVFTGAGTLPFKGVIHCVAIDPWHDSSVDIVQQCVRNTLRIVKELWNEEPVRLGLPVLATGHGHLAFEVSLQAMVDELSGANLPARTDLVFVVYEASQVNTARSILDSCFGTIEMFSV